MAGRRAARAARAAPLPSGWQPLGAGRDLPVPPFTRLARAHALSAAGDALIAISLAGSLFFSISPDAARGRVALYLLLTMAPFAVVAPLLGPLLDRSRGGRRTLVVGSLAARAVLCVLMVRHLQGLLLFPEAFGVLVLGKGYGVLKTSLVPTVVERPEDLVQANAQLSLVSGVSGFVAGGPGVVLLQLGPGWVLALATVVSVAGAGAALSIPPTPSPPAARRDERGASQEQVGLVLAAGAMAVLRGVVGFLAFFLAFRLREEGAPTWLYGVVLAASGAGALAGAGLVGPLRRHAREERILLGSLVGVSAGALVALQVSGRPSGVVLAMTVGVAAAAGRVCFDAVVQREVPPEQAPRAFARYETRFQLAWVAGALVPVVITLPRDLGYAVIAVLTTVAAASYLTGGMVWGRLARSVVGSARRRLRPRWRRRRSEVDAGEPQTRRVDLRRRR